MKDNLHQPDTKATNRPKRIPIGSRSVLRFPQRPGFVRRIVNDDPNGTRVQAFLDAGYSIVEGDISGGPPKAGDPSKMGAQVRKQVGGGLQAVLMEIREDWYNEDQKAKQEPIDAQERDMRRNIRPGTVDANGNYGKVTISGELTEE